MNWILHHAGEQLQRVLLDCWLAASLGARSLLLLQVIQDLPLVLVGGVRQETRHLPFSFVLFLNEALGLPAAWLTRNIIVKDGRALVPALSLGDDLTVGCRDCPSDPPVLIIIILNIVAQVAHCR